uniref:CAZy families GH23 protein n=1 Tax=uncultured Enterococcus sp. TaxID=167972 RepID=A0A060BU12_9ENTE|nr:CAZy families GH23 protein [uncultured Enterococcus sp.]
MSAAAAIGDLNWSGTLPKWKVIKNPKYSDLRPGDIVNWKAGSQLTKGSTYTVDPTYGHTAIISSVDGDNKYTAYSQNPTPVTIVHWEYVGSLHH